MHELGIVYEVIKIVDGFAEENQLKHVEKIVLEIGELSQAIPRFIEECFPAAVADTCYENTQLEIIVEPADGICTKCETVFNIISHRKTCPKCGAQAFKPISGQAFNIKEIVAY